MAKRKNKIAPSFDFNSALFSYRQKYGHWPNSELAFFSYDSKVVKDNLYQGFEAWSLGRFSQDTIYIY